MFQRRNNSKRLYYAYQSMWVAVGKELPCQSEQANPEDPFASAGKLIIGRENFRSLVDAFMTKWVTFLLNLLNPWVDDNVLVFLNSSG